MAGTVFKKIIIVILEKRLRTKLLWKIWKKLTVCVGARGSIQNYSFFLYFPPYPPLHKFNTINVGGSVWRTVLSILYNFMIDIARVLSKKNSFHKFFFFWVKGAIFFSRLLCNSDIQIYVFENIARYSQLEHSVCI